MTSTIDSLTAALRQRDLDVALRQKQGVHAALRAAIFNGAIEPRARALVTCRNEADVQSAVRAAADQGTPVAVVAGGHDMWARGLLDDNLVLDVRSISQIGVDASAREVTIGGGVLTGELFGALPDDLVAPTGTVLTVGVTGQALAGGYGTLTSRFGLAADGIRRARVVLADGSVVTASDRENADLLWALRGGGTGFGVVTSLTLALHPLAGVLSAMITWPLDRAKDAMLLAQDMMDRHPVDLSVLMGFTTWPTGDVVLFARPLWSGEATTGEALLGELADRDGATVIHRGWSAYKQTFSADSEKAFPKGRHYHLLTQTLRRLDQASADVLVDGAARMPKPTSAMVLHDFHGMPAQVPPGATAFPLRDDHFVVELIASWDESADRHSNAEMEWVERVEAELAAVALPGGYAPFLKLAETDRVRAFYGSAAPRLLDIKRRVDPRDLFRAGMGRLPSG